MQLKEPLTFNRIYLGLDVSKQVRSPVTTHFINQHNQPNFMTMIKTEIKSPNNSRINIKPYSISFNQNNKIDLNASVSQRHLRTNSQKQNMFNKNYNNLCLPCNKPIIANPEQIFMRPPLSKLPAKQYQQLSVQMIRYPMRPSSKAINRLPIKLPQDYPFSLALGSKSKPAPTYIGYKIQTDRQILPSKILDINIQNQKVYCVICQQQYSLTEKTQHIFKHKKNINETSKIKNLIKQYKQQNKVLKHRPIVQPQQYNIQYNPNQFILQKQTNYLTPVIQPLIRSQSGVGTTDSTDQTNIQDMKKTNLNLSPINISGITSTISPDRPISLTFQGQRLSYIEPTSCQGEILFKQNQLNPKPQAIEKNYSDAQLMRNTFISDDQPSAYKLTSHRSLLNNQPFNLTQSMTSHLLNKRNTTNSNISGILSQNYSETGFPITSSRITDDQDYIAKKIAANHYSIMSPIRQQTQNRNTASQGNFDEYFNQNQREKHGSTQIRETLYSHDRNLQTNNEKNTINSQIL